MYDPTDHSDRLLLGLHGVMNEAELHVPKSRMDQGKLNKARRGELFATPPIGYVWSPDRRWAIDPDEHVRAVVRLIFDQFDREATMHGLLRHLVHHASGSWSGSVRRSVRRYDQHSDYPRLVGRLREFCEERLGSGVIAKRLNAEGFRPPKRATRFTAEMVRRLAVLSGLSRRARHGSRVGLVPDEYRPMELARRLGVGRDAVRGWVRSGWVNVRRDADAHHVIWVDGDELRRLCELRGLQRTWENKARLAELKKPKPRPAR